MPKRLVSEQLAAELAAINRILATLPQDDLLGRIGFESRRDELVEELGRLNAREETAASIALMFGGAPVLGSRGIAVSFSTAVIGTFQTLITNVWATTESSEVGTRGPVPDQKQSQMHITSLLHGSVGFLLEEIGDGESQWLFESPLKRAADRVAEIVAAFAEQNEDRFSSVLETVDQRVLGSAREFFKQMHGSGATLKMVEGSRQIELLREDIGRAFQRAESSEIDEWETEINGVFLGMIPVARRFEFQTDSGEFITGSVAPTLSESYLKRLAEEKPVRPRCRGRVRVKRVTRFGKVTEARRLLDLEQLDA